jgi:rhodanese-related sulfurtransferase
MIDTITRDELKNKMDQHTKFTLVETLPEKDFKQRHLPGAINVPAAKTKDLGHELPNKDAEIVVYCANESCPASEEAGLELARRGYSHVRRYAGGKQDWIDAGFPTEGQVRMKSTKW